jgi:integrase
VPDDETARWITQLDEVMKRRLAKAGLIEAAMAVRLGPFLDDYIHSRKDVKASTHLVYNHTRRNLVDFFGKNKLLREITEGDADNFRIFLANHENLADNTVRRRMGIAKQYFRAAMRRKLISENPFQGQSCLVRDNRAKNYFITVEEARAVLDACPNAQWRMLFGLCRWGGLRCPSEVLRLTWDDVDWDKRRFTVHASKTEHHVDGGIRQVPMFPELVPLFHDVFDQAEPGEKHVITQYRDPSQNLRTQFKKIIKRAGLTPWPKLFQNLRSTRETELADQYPIQVVCAWIGNSPQVAAKHYLQVREDYFDTAAGNADGLPPEPNAQVPANLIDQWNTLPESSRQKILDLLQNAPSAH